MLYEGTVAFDFKIRVQRHAEPTSYLHENALNNIMLLTQYTVRQLVHCIVLFKKK